jgi:lipid-A-disaccharide synthase
MLGAAKELLRKHPDASFHAAHVSPVERENLAAHARAAGVPLTVHGDRVHAVMASCRCAIVGSGTATLETALFGTPLVIVYQISRSASRFGWLVVAPFYGQANLLLGRVVAPELIFIEGETDREARLVAATEPLMTDTPEWRAQREAFEGLRARQPKESAIERAAQRLLPRLRAPVATR